MVNSRMDETEIRLTCGSRDEPGMRAKWLHVHDESEWSLKTSLIFRF